MENGLFFLLLACFCCFALSEASHVLLLTEVL